MTAMRRIVMARSASGTMVLRDTDLPRGVSPPGLTGIELVGLWEAAPIPELPVDPSYLVRDVTALPPPGATSFRLVRMEPGSGMAMHETDTIDYLVVLSGEVALEPEGGSAEILKVGDCVVQLGGRHAWKARGDAPCVIAAVIVGSRSGGPVV